MNTHHRSFAPWSVSVCGVVYHRSWKTTSAMDSLVDAENISTWQPVDHDEL